MSLFKSIDAQQAKAWLDNQDAVIVDVREPEEYATMHIAGATLIPLGQLTQDKLPTLNNNKKLIIHCQLGKRGSMACEKLLQQDPSLELYNLEGGIIAWQRAGLHVETAKCEMLPLARQVQVTIGSGVLLGLVAGYFVHPAFLLVSAFLGFGLVWSGVTGSCRLAQLLSKMPWNNSNKT